MSDNPQVTDLVTRARNGDRAGVGRARRTLFPADLVDLPPVPAGRADGEDVSQAVWVRLVDQVDSLREPAALPGWLGTTTRHECARVRRATWRHSAAGQVSKSRTYRTS